MILSTQEIIEKYNLQPYRQDKTNFIKFCKLRGIEISFVEKNGRTNYFEIINDTTILQNEKWIKCQDLPEFEVSSEGRIKKGNRLYSGNNSSGYTIICIANKNYRVHRLVLNSFQPIDNPDNFVVDHINGIKTDNRLENLRWVSAIDNTKLSCLNRKPFDKELTRLIEKYGYDETLKIIKNIT